MGSRLPWSAEEQFWARHSNPKSGWSRVPTGPVLVYAIYHRRWRLLVAGFLWTLLNPVLFPPPEDEEAWMTRAVLAERWWTRIEGNPTVGLSYPNVCNLGSAATTVATILAAWRQRPVGTAVGTTLAVSLKFWWLRVLVRRYDQRPD